ncbi:MAG: transposase domain-containing protein [Acetobacteraceae bacterium]
MTLIQTAKLNGVDPMAWLTDVLEQIVSWRTSTAFPWIDSYHAASAIL